MKYQIFKQKSSEMKGLNLRIREAKQGFLFFAFSTLLIALQFGFYITDSSILELMDFILHNLLHQPCSHVCADTISS